MNIFKGIFDTAAETVISIGDFFLCLGFALLIGLYLSFVYTFGTRYTKSFLITLGILPATVAVVIMMVNGNIGAGVAVAGAFSLVRFRSAPGTAKEIASIFIAMATGLIVGMGYLAYAVLFALVMGVVLVISSKIKLSDKKFSKEKTLRITVPESLDYSGIFDEVLEKYTTSYELIKVKTTNLGALFKLTYNINEKDVSKEKTMIDDLRTRNGNLEIMISEREAKNDEL